MGEILTSLRVTARLQAEHLRHQDQELHPGHRHPPLLVLWPRALLELGPESHARVPAAYVREGHGVTLQQGPRPGAEGGDREPLLPDGQAAPAPGLLLWDVEVEHLSAELVQDILGHLG